MEGDTEGERVDLREGLRAKKGEEKTEQGSSQDNRSRVVGERVNGEQMSEIRMRTVSVRSV